MSIYPQQYFSYQGIILSTDGLDLSAIALEYGTPLYVYSATALQAAVADLRRVFGTRIKPAFAVKACPHLSILRLLAKAGLGADIVSGGELTAALRAGFAPADVIFSGCGKTDAELQQAVASGVGRINVESRSELLRLNNIALAAGRKQAIGLRLNPDTAAHTLPGIATGRNSDKFGIGRAVYNEVYAEACRLPGLEVTGVAVHIGSQLFNVDDYKAAYQRVAATVAALRAAGCPVDEVDLGGGFGVPYRASDPVFDLKGYFRLVKRLFGPDLKLKCEPGRFITANAAVLLSRVVTVKQETGRPLLITLDAGMNDLLRPALYGARHELLPVAPRASRKRQAIFTGPVCESSDVFGRYTLPTPHEGDVLALLSAGAYGSAMSSDYNLRARPAVILVQDGRAVIIRKRSDVFIDEIDYDSD